MRRAVLSVLAGCGRLAFDASASDAQAPCSTPAGHDEDGDQIDDRCDVCPHLPDPPQLDGDGDGVGDICDPYPSAPTERIAMFDPLTTRRPEWRFGGNAPVYSGDSIDVDVRVGGMAMAFSAPPANDVYVVGLSFDTPITNRPTQLTLGVLVENQNATYYCELYDNHGSSKQLAYIYTFDGSVYGGYDYASADDLTSGVTVLAMHHTPSGVTCDTTWPATRQQLTGPLPSGIAANSVQFYAQGLVLSVQYLLWIHSD